MITVQGAINRSEFSADNRIMYGSYGIACSQGGEATADYFGHLLNVEFVGTVSQVCGSRDAVDWREPVTVIIANEGERVTLCEFDCDGTHPVSGTEAFLAIENFDKPGKWRLVAELIG